MAVKRDRIGIVGATSLLGKELSEELADSPMAAAEIVLLDEDAGEGQLSAAGDEPAFVRTIDETSLRGLDLVFFAGSPELTRTHWEAARRSGALVVDLTRALLGEPGVPLRAPAVSEAIGDGSALPSLETVAVVPAHPLAAMLMLLSARLGAGLEQIAATVLLPASEHGRAALDELHQQTVNLLSFHSLPLEQFDAQTAFNLLPALGEDARVDLADVERQILADAQTLGGKRVPTPLLQVIEAPVFHGYGLSVLLTLRHPSTPDALKQQLRGRYVHVVVTDEEEAPSNLAIAGLKDLLIQVRGANERGQEQKQFWLWAAGDNLKVRAEGAIDCAVELRRLRPSGKVQ